MLKIYSIIHNVTAFRYTVLIFAAGVVNGMDTLISTYKPTYFNLSHVIESINMNFSAKVKLFEGLPVAESGIEFTCSVCNNYQLQFVIILSLEPYIIICIFIFYLNYLNICFFYSFNYIIVQIYKIDIFIFIYIYLYDQKHKTYLSKNFHYISLSSISFHFVYLYYPILHT